MQTLPFSVPPYLLPVEQVARQLATDPELGLSDNNVKDRQQQYGPNAVVPVRVKALMWRRRCKLAEDPDKADRECDDVGPFISSWCIVWDWIIY
jgi:hypothetical protein